MLLREVPVAEIDSVVSIVVRLSRVGWGYYRFHFVDQGGCPIRFTWVPQGRHFVRGLVMSGTFLKTERKVHLGQASDLRNQVFVYLLCSTDGARQGSCWPFDCEATLSITQENIQVSLLHVHVTSEPMAGFIYFV
jgi:hypothetical protein